MLVFISYETTTGLSYASHLKEALRKINISAFVADEDIPEGTQWRNVIDEAIKNCKYFVVIMTIVAIHSSDEVKREIELANQLDKNIIPCKPRKVDRFFTSTLPLVSDLQQVDFDGKEDLADQITTAIEKREREKVVVRTGVEEARRTEYHNVQSAVIAMMVDNNLTRIPNPQNYAGGIGVNDMSAFPDSRSAAGSADKLNDPNGYAYSAGHDKDGYILYAHDITGSYPGNPNPNQRDVNYVTVNASKYYYTCEADGTVRQWSDASLSTEYTY